MHPGERISLLLHGRFVSVCACAYVCPVCMHACLRQSSHLATTGASNVNSLIWTFIANGICSLKEERQEAAEQLVSYACADSRLRLCVWKVYEYVRIYVRERVCMGILSVHIHTYSCLLSFSLSLSLPVCVRVCVTDGHGVRCVARGRRWPGLRRSGPNEKTTQASSNGRSRSMRTFQCFWSCVIL